MTEDQAVEDRTKDLSDREMVESLLRRGWRLRKNKTKTRIIVTALGAVVVLGGLPFVGTLEGMTLGGHRAANEITQKATAAVHDSVIRFGPQIKPTIVQAIGAGADEAAKRYGIQPVAPAHEPRKQAIDEFVRSVKAAKWVIDGRVIDKKFNEDSKKWDISIEVKHDYGVHPLSEKSIVVWPVGDDEVDNIVHDPSMFVLGKGENAQILLTDDDRRRTLDDAKLYIIDGNDQSEMAKFFFDNHVFDIGGLASKSITPQKGVADSAGIHRTLAP